MDERPPGKGETQQHNIVIIITAPKILFSQSSRASFNARWAYNEVHVLLFIWRTKCSVSGGNNNVMSLTHSFCLVSLHLSVCAHGFASMNYVMANERFQEKRIRSCIFFYSVEAFEKLEHEHSWLPCFFVGVSTFLQGRYFFTGE